MHTNEEIKNALKALADPPSLSGEMPISEEMLISIGEVSLTTPLDSFGEREQQYMFAAIQLRQEFSKKFAEVKSKEEALDMVRGALDKELNKPALSKVIEELEAYNSNTREVLLDVESYGVDAHQSEDLKLFLELSLIPQLTHLILYIFELLPAKEYVKADGMYLDRVERAAKALRKAKGYMLELERMVHPEPFPNLNKFIHLCEKGALKLDEWNSENNLGRGKRGNVPLATLRNGFAKVLSTFGFTDYSITHHFYRFASLAGHKLSTLDNEEKNIGRITTAEKTT